MAIAAHPSLIATVGIVALIGWRVYARVRRSIGRQKFLAVRTWITVAVFPLLVALLMLVALSHTDAALALMAGVAVGAGLGVIGIRLTRFEATPEGLFYRPNAHLGVALSLLLLGRIGYRVLQVYFWDSRAGMASSDFVASPLTLGIFGTLAGYYVLYAIGLLRWRRQVEAALPANPAAPAG